VSPFMNLTCIDEVYLFLSFFMSQSRFFKSRGLIGTRPVRQLPGLNTFRSSEYLLRSLESKWMSAAESRGNKYRLLLLLLHYKE
jgi:hypothetical protein